MREARHIFEKDVRHLWRQTLIVVAANAGLAYAVLRLPSVAGVISVLLAVTWWALIASLIYAEPLAGEQPFWMTRPYRRISLVAAKALFIVLFVCLPKLASDIAVLRAFGFRIGTEWGGLLWSQLLLTASFVLPIVALVAITAGFAQLVPVTLLSFLAIA